MGLTQVQVTLSVYLMSFERWVRNIIGTLFIQRWRQMEKENVVPVEYSMLSEVIRIQYEGFENKNRDEVRRYSKRMRKIFYVIKSQGQVVGY